MDLRALELMITDIVDDYIKKRYNENDVVAIGHHGGGIVVTADSREKIQANDDMELYPLRDLVMEDNDNRINVDYNKISDIANSWIF